MKSDYQVIPKDTSFAVSVKGKMLTTPGKRPFVVSTQALAEAIAAEWRTHQKFLAGRMTITALAYTAIDRIEGNEEAIVEALMAYVDTDTLSYRSSSSNLSSVGEGITLYELQLEQWDPVLHWAGKEFGGIWQITTGIMPLTQPEVIHDSIRRYLRSLDAMRLAAACILVSGFSSIVLASAVLEKYLDAEKAFWLSRLEEEMQAEAWGRVHEVEQRKQRLQAEILAAVRFLSLLEG